MCACVAKLNLASALFAVGWFCAGFDFGGPFGQLLGLGDQQVGAGIDAYVLELGRLFAQLARLVQVVGKTACISRVGFIKCVAGGGKWQCEIATGFCPQKQRAGADCIEECPIVAGDNHGHITGQGTQPVFQQPDSVQVEVVGWFV